MNRDVDQISDLVIKQLPGIKVEQLECKHEADDDGIWFFKKEGSDKEVQIESSSGNCPFLIESDFTDERITKDSIEGTVETVLYLLNEG